MTLRQNANFILEAAKRPAETITSGALEVEEASNPPAVTTPSGDLEDAKMTPAKRAKTETEEKTETEDGALEVQTEMEAFEKDLPNVLKVSENISFL